MKKTDSTCSMRTLSIYIAFVCCTCMNAQTIAIYKSGKLVKEYAATQADSVVFKEAPTVDFVSVTYNGTTTKWAKRNLGATSIADDAASAYGDYYAWGELDTYYSDKAYTTYNSGNVFWKYSDKTHFTGNKTRYGWSNYCQSTSFSEWDPVPYTENYTMYYVYDIATQTLGGTWRMPTETDFDNLCRACGMTEENYYILTPCKSESSIKSKGIYWIDYNADGIKIGSTTYKVPGILCVPNNKKLDEVVFFPAAGGIKSTSFLTTGTHGNYWSSSIVKDYTYNAHIMEFNSEYVLPHNGTYRYIGMTIRPVSD